MPVLLRARRPDGHDAVRNCGRKIEHWQTGFYTRQPLPKRTRTTVWIVAAIALLLIIGGLRAILPLAVGRVVSPVSVFSSRFSVPESDDMTTDN